jgi:hypothetical protein
VRFADTIPTVSAAGFVSAFSSAGSGHSYQFLRTLRLEPSFKNKAMLTFGKAAPQRLGGVLS